MSDKFLELLFRVGMKGATECGRGFDPEKERSHQDALLPATICCSLTNHTEDVLSALLASKIANLIRYPLPL